MVKLDSIFKSLGIETENDVRLLAQYFVNHRQFKELLKSKANTNNNSNNQGSGSGGSESGSTNNNNNNEGGSERAAAVAALDEPIELIHPNEVLTAIKTFLSFHRKQEK